MWKFENFEFVSLPYRTESNRIYSNEPEPNSNRIRVEPEPNEASFIWIKVLTFGLNPYVATQIRNFHSMSYSF